MIKYWTSHGWESTIGLVLCLTLLPTCSARLSDTFANFFPTYNAGFQTIIHENCSSEYSSYLTSKDGTKAFLENNPEFGGLGPANILVNCILEATPEVIKTKLASAQIILGLAPTILAAVGIRPQDSAMLAMLARKPILAGLLALGSPAVPVARASEYRVAIQDLQKPGLSSLHLKPRPLKSLLSIAIYAIAAASVANVVQLAWQMSACIPFGAFPSDTYMPLLWTFLGTIIHVLATFAMWYVVTVHTASSTNYNALQQSSLRTDEQLNTKGAHSSLFHIKDVLSLGEFGHSSRLRVQFLPANLTFNVISWLTSVFTACHVVFGTILFASALFISIDDALILIGRLLGSAVACRILLKLEIVLLQARIEVTEARVDT